MKLNRQSCLIGFVTGVACSVSFYFAILHETESTRFVPSPSGTSFERNTLVRILPKAIQFDADQLSELVQLPMRDVWDRLGLSHDPEHELTEKRLMKDDWPETHFASCDEVIAIPIQSSGNYLVIGILYNHAHVVSAFCPRWNDSEPSNGPESPTG